MADPLLEALWKRVLDAWDDDRAHGAFLRHCQETEQLGEAAVRYKGMTGDRDRGESAEKRLGGVTILALHTLTTNRSPPRRRGSSWWLSAIVLAMSIGVLWYASRMFQSGEP